MDTEAFHVGPSRLIGDHDHKMIVARIHICRDRDRDFGLIALLSGRNIIGFDQDKWIDRHLDWLQRTFPRLRTVTVMVKIVMYIQTETAQLNIIGKAGSESKSLTTFEGTALLWKCSHKAHINAWRNIINGIPVFVAGN